MDHLKEGIRRRGYAQQNPLQQYKKKASSCRSPIDEPGRHHVVEKLFTVQSRAQTCSAWSTAAAAGAMSMERRRRCPSTRGENRTGGRDMDKVGRNDPCPCGSGKKFKKCHGS